MGGGGGASTDINQMPGGFRSWQNESKDINKGYQFQQDQFNQFGQNNPLLNAANTNALDFNSQLSGLLAPLQQMFQQMPNISPVISNLQKQFGGLPKQIMGMSTTLQRQFGNQPGQLQGLTKPLMNTAKGYLSGILGSQGALSPEASRDVAQQTRQLASQYGTGRQLGTLGTELLNRQGAREARYNTALGQYGQATGQIGMLDQLAQSLGTNLATTRAGLGQASQGLGLGLASGLQGLRGTNIAQRTGLASGIQGLQTGGQNQLLGTLQGGVQSFSGLTNPILGYLSNMFGGNQQAAIAQAGVNQQANTAASNKSGGMASGALSAVASIAPLLMMSDERMKTKIKDTGLKTIENIPLKTWEDKTRPGKRFLSPLAQDVESKLPERVLTDPVSGVKFISGFPMVEVSPIKKAA